MKMNQDIKEEWIALLENGGLTQVKGELANSSGYCCLGVLCEIAAASGVVKRDGYLFDNSCGVLPDSVMDWAAISHRKARFGDQYDNLADLNDNGSTFKQIAKVIKKNF